VAQPVPVVATVRPSEPAKTSPASEELRRVLAEIKQMDTSFLEKRPAPKPIVPPKPVEPKAEPKVAPAVEPKAEPKPLLPKAVDKAKPRVVFVPAREFDDLVLQLRGCQAVFTEAQTVNERLGTVETHAKASVDSLAQSFETIHAALLMMDERLFPVK
jgi:hypothetical protein